MTQRYFAPTYVTFAGVSDNTDIDRLLALSAEYPLIEWGILYSHQRAGNDPSYPSLAWIDEFFDKSFASGQDLTNFSIHLCGAAVQDFVEDSSPVDFLYRYMASQKMRIQLNFNLKKAAFTIRDLQNAVHGHLVPIITQHNENNQELINHPFADNHQILFDNSLGFGIQPTSWPAPIPEKACGYAGGIGPDNIGLVAIDIMAVAADPFWIDMQSKIRTGNVLDLEKCIRVIQMVSGLRTLVDAVG